MEPTNMIPVPESLLRPLVGLAIVGILAVGYNLGLRVKLRDQKKA